VIKILFFLILCSTCLADPKVVYRDPRFRGLPNPQDGVIQSVEGQPVTQCVVKCECIKCGHKWFWRFVGEDYKNRKGIVKCNFCGKKFLRLIKNEEL